MHLVEQFPLGTEDEIWIPRVAAEPRTIITRDLNIKKHRLHRELFQEHAAGGFVFAIRSRGERMDRLL